MRQQLDQLLAVVVQIILPRIFLQLELLPELVLCLRVGKLFHQIPERLLQPAIVGRDEMLV